MHYPNIRKLSTARARVGNHTKMEERGPFFAWKATENRGKMHIILPFQKGSRQKGLRVWGPRDALLICQRRDNLRPRLPLPLTITSKAPRRDAAEAGGLGTLPGRLEGGAPQPLSSRPKEKSGWQPWSSGNINRLRYEQDST